MRGRGLWRRPGPARSGPESGGTRGSDRGEGGLAMEDEADKDLERRERPARVMYKSDTHLIHVPGNWLCPTPAPPPPPPHPPGRFPSLPRHVKAKEVPFSRRHIALGSTR